MGHVSATERESKVMTPESSIAIQIFDRPRSLIRNPTWGRDG
jgi:hypothetical protein